MISVSEALDRLFALAMPLKSEVVPLQEALGRVLAEDAISSRAQPPFAASAMDGYAVLDQEVREGAIFTVIGEAAAGHRFDQPLAPGTAVRIFTGAPVPEGATRVVIQEDVERRGHQVVIKNGFDSGRHIRPAAGDFDIGAKIAAPRLLRPEDIALLASMNVAGVRVTRRPVVALISTGDELVMPGETPGPDQIIASNTFGLHALLVKLGAMPRILPIARDSPSSLALTFDLAADADLIVTIGGASVGDHDLVAKVAAARGMEQALYTVAMRPGKPLMAGCMGGAMMLGLPGNPVSAMVCGHVFLSPVIRAMLGLGQDPAPRRTARLGVRLGINGPREHYMRATLTAEGIRPFQSQDSSLLSVLAQSDALLVRPPNDAARHMGDMVEYLPLDGG